MAKNKFTESAAKSLFGGTAERATKKQEERKEQPSVTTTDSDLEALNQWAEWMDKRPDAIRKGSTLQLTRSMAYAMAAREFANDHPNMAFARQAAKDAEDRIRLKKGRPKKTDGSKGAYFIVDPTQLAKIQAIAKENKVQVKEILFKMFQKFIEEYESKHGVIELNKQIDIDELFKF